jgi:hypothetical protein
MKITTLITFLLSFSITIFSQDIRTFDGSGNNLNNPTWGAVNTNLLRLTNVNYADGVFMPGGHDWPNPREISNLIFDQNGLINDKLELSDFVWAFGQFIDHDITLVPDQETEPMFIFVPEGDPWMDPFGWGNALIPMARSAYDPTTGTDPSNPRQHFNAITAFIDGSAVYGSSKDVADWLRTFQDGRLKTSEGNLLPYNTIDGEKDSPIDPNAPEMADPVGISNKHFVAGDIRANENSILITLHTLFVREHNRICSELKAENPSWNDEQLFQEARRKVGAIIQAITYEEWLPAMGVNVLNYQGYNPFKNAGISNVFSGAAFRLGHTLINTEITRLDENGAEISAGNINMREAFFNPLEIEAAGGIEPYLRGMAAQMQQECDVKVIDDLRNFLFGPPGAGGLDLASININRGRERGIPSFNSVRQSFGLDPIESFYDLTSHVDWADKMEVIYGDINKLDAWVGMLAEDHVPGALFGETIMVIMNQQFSDLRDGDRFYYENDSNFDPNELWKIKTTTMADIIRRNTNIEAIQDDVFIATPHDGLCTTDEPVSEIAGGLEFYSGGSIMDVTVEIFEPSGGMPIYSIAGMGDYEFSDMATCEDYMIRPVKDINWSNGVTTFDLVLIRKQVLGVKDFTSPYQYIAADLDLSETITQADMILAQKIILGITTDFDEIESWKFMPNDFEFENPYDPWGETIPEKIIVSNLQDPATANFKAIKMGDVNFNANPSNIINSDDRNEEDALVFNIENQTIRYGEEVSIGFSTPNCEDLEGFQFTLNYDPTKLDFLDLENGVLENLTQNNFHLMEKEGAITFSWVGEAKKICNSNLFYINFVSKADQVELRDLISLNSRFTPTEAITKDLKIMNVVIEFEGAEGSIAQHQYELYQNQPNPFAGSTFIGFNLPKPSKAILDVYDVTGKVLKTIEGTYERGYNQITLERKDLPSVGILYYKLETEFGILTKKMIME